MALLYLDTSALVKLYVQETGTERMLELVHPDAGNSLAIVSLARVEFRAAVRRRERLGDINAGLASELIQSFSRHCASSFQVQPANDMVLDQAAGVIDRHRLRAYDAVQLGGCLTLRSTVGADIDLQFLCADQTLLDAARTEGLTAVNPSAA